MAFEFKLPDIGEGVVEGEIVQWLVKPGDAVAVDQPMVEVMTDKATVVISSPVEGVVRETRGAEGDLVEVHAVVCVIETEGSDAPPASAPSGSTPADAAPMPSATTDGPPSGADPTPVAASGSGAKVLAAPATRRLARELGVEIAAVQGTGPAGRVLETDVRAAAARSSAPAATPPARPAPVAAGPSWPGDVDERIPVRGLRRRIWDKMAQSAFTAAHFTFVESCDCSAVVQMRKRFNQRLGPEEAKLTFLPFIVKAVVASLKKFRSLNGHVDDADMSFIQRGDYHIGVAVSSDRGLVVPVIRHADRRSILDIGAEIARLAEAVRANTITPEELGGSTFTITSLGKDGGIFATPIINYPEVAILGVHRLQKTPVVDDNDEIVVRPVMNLSLSFDHRLIDGHVGAEFTYSVIRLLEDPDRLMMEMA